jgi:hypothetical protein
MRRAHQPAVAAVALAMALVMAAPLPAQAWEPATTQAGLTERALVASGFHKVMAGRLARPSGAFEALSLQSRLLPAGERQNLWARLQALDPAGGYRPDGEGVASALQWVIAGAVLAETPPERGRNHFFDPRSGRGLDDRRGLSGTAHALKLALDEGGGVRGLATGTVFNMTGKASLRWVKAPENSQGLAVFQQQLARAVGAEEPIHREGALVQALLALGGMLAALEDAGEPAHVRNDFRQAFLEPEDGSGSWNQASRFERFVARRYGRSGLPAPPAVVRRPTFDSFFAASDGAGLADRTQRRFFSDGTVPDEVPVNEASTTRDVVEAARASLVFPLPTVGRLELRGPAGGRARGPDGGERRYMLIEGRRALGYQRLPGRVRFFLDERVYADAARALLPDVAAYAAGLIDHLFRAQVTLVAEGGQVAVGLEGAAGGKADGKLELYVEDAGGRRRALATPDPARSSFPMGSLFQVALPAGTRRVGAVLRGSDAGGELIAIGDLAVP